jgi:hypothetical protein
MLPDKMASLVAARQELAASEVSNSRLIARVRGKALHYGCLIPFIAVAIPSLSQLMHGRETGAGPIEVPSLDTEKELEFDWDMKVRMSEGASILQDIGRGAPYLAHPRRVRRASNGSSMALLWLILAHLGSSWLFFFWLFLSTSLGRSSWLIYRSSIAHLRGLVGVQPFIQL